MCRSEFQIWNEIREDKAKALLDFTFRFSTDFLSKTRLHTEDMTMIWRKETKDILFDVRGNGIEKKKKKAKKNKENVCFLMT